MSDLPAKSPPTAAQRFAGLVDAVARTELTKLAEANPDRFREAAARVPLALRAAVNSAKDPAAILNMATNNPASVGACVALSALTGIMPGGAYPGCYLIPMDGALQWWLNHRGIIALASRAGLTVQVIPHYEGDNWTFRQGLNPDLSHERGIGPATLDTLVGVGVLVTRGRDLVGMIDVEKPAIIQRRAKSRSGNVWRDWPIEMAMKTAVKLACARGIILLDDIGSTAISADADREAEASEIIQRRPSIPLPPRAIADTGAISGDDDTREPSEAERAAILEQERREAGGGK